MKNHLVFGIKINLIILNKFPDIMTNKESDKLGKAQFDQASIDDNTNYHEVENIFFENLDEFQKYINIDDELEIELLNKLKNKIMSFPLNFQSANFIKKFVNNFELISKYLIFRYKFHLTGSKKINLGYPPYLLIEPVATCNLRCPFCFQTDPTFTRKPYMGVIDFEFFKKIIDEADEIGVGAVTLASRGEPTLHKKLSDMVEYIKNKENIFEIKINTNGSFLSENLCHKILKNDVNQVVISADHYEKKDYERLRLGANFEKIVSNVDMLFDIRKKFYPNCITEIRISGVDNEKNLDRKKFHEFWIKRSDHVTACFPMERWDTYNNKIHPDINSPCELLFDRMYIWWDGKVNPCDADYKSYLSFGNYNENSIKDLWNNSLIQKVRNDHLAGMRQKHNPCNKCGADFK